MKFPTLILAIACIGFMIFVNTQEAKIIQQQRTLIKQMQENPACMVEGQ